MRAPASAAAHWTKTFYWHSHQETIDDPAHDASVGDDRGLLHGILAGNVYGRPAYTAYGSIAGPPTMSGSNYASNVNVDVTATPAVPGPAYHYVWEYQWCANTGYAADCDYQWYPYAAGTASTVSPYVDEGDFWVHVRVRQYAWQGGPQIAGGEWDIQGPGHSSASCGTQITCDGGGGGGFAATPQAMTATTGASGAGVAKVHYAIPSIERRKGIGHGGNR